MQEVVARQSVSNSSRKSIVKKINPRESFVEATPV
jgi:hypothetical protein